MLLPVKQVDNSCRAACGRSPKENTTVSPGKRSLIVRVCSGNGIAIFDTPEAPIFTLRMVAPVPMVPKVPLNIFSLPSTWYVNGTLPSTTADITLSLVGDVGDHATSIS